MPPPTILRQRRASSMNSLEPTSTEPTGAPSPLDRHTDTVSQGREMSATLQPVAGGIEKPGAVEMQGESVAIGKSSGRRKIVGSGGPAGLGILQAQQAGPGEVHIVGFDERFHRCQIQGAVGLEWQRLWLDTAKRSGATAFVPVGVCRGAGDVFVTALAVGEQRDQIGLRTGGHEQSGFLAEHFRGQASRALTVGSSPYTSSPTSAVIIASRIAGGRPGDGIASQIYPGRAHRKAGKPGLVVVFGHQ